ncbi:Threonine aldolase [Hanseniaspora valbyensis]
MQPYTSSSNDFRSDTFTTPTKEMLEAVNFASIGDAVYNEDVNTIQLEKTVADIFGKPAGLFCTSGTMSNQIGIRTLLNVQPPYSIICDYRAHIYTHEAAGLAMLSQAMVTPVIPKNGNYLTVEDLEKWIIRADGDIHSAPTFIVSLEQTLHGMVTPFDELIRIKKFCIENNIKLHCDGARIWNACVKQNIDPKKYGTIFDSISVCLSKSMGAPIGSVLLGSPNFIKKANHFRKQVGGGIRQSGIISSMALVAIQPGWERKLQYSHDLAAELNDYLVNELNIPLESPTETSFVFIDLESAKINPDVLVKKALKYGCRVMGGRIAFHYQIDRENISKLKLAIKETYEYSKKYPFDHKGPTQIYRSESTDIINADIQTYKY